MVKKEGVEDLVDIQLQDYRKIEGNFDKIISIEMFEAVGEHYWHTFFKVIREKLKVGGLAALQVITINNQRFYAYRRNPDYIQKYIFPGGMLPCVYEFKKVANKVGLSMNTPRFFGSDYIKTLNLWLNKFEKSISDIQNLGFNKKFERMWHYYLAYCIAGFRTGNINVMQVVMW